MKKLLFIVIFFSIISNVSASIKENIIKKFTDIKNVSFDFESGKVESIFNKLIPSICALDEYVVSFFAIEFKFLKYMQKLFLNPKFDIKSFEL